MGQMLANANTCEVDAYVTAAQTGPYTLLHGSIQHISESEASHVKPCRDSGRLTTTKPEMVFGRSMLCRCRGAVALMTNRRTH